MSSITSDITLDASRFDPENITEETIQVNAFIEKTTTQGPQWHEVGAQKYRQMRETGETPLPPPVYLPGAKDVEFPSRDAGRTIPVRVYTPDNGQPSKGIFLHIHGGGFVLSTHKDQNAALKRYANTCQLTAISVGYRLAPEHPWPAAVHDCVDVAERLADHGPSAYGAPLLFISGESAGGCLAVRTAFHLLRERPRHRLAGMVLPCGWFDLTLNLPSVARFKRPLLVNCEKLGRFAEAYTPGMGAEGRRDPGVSPLYEDLNALARGDGGLLPPALFLCGTEDPLLDDTLLMSAKWMASGSEAVVKIYPGAPHAFTVFAGYGPGEEAASLGLRFIKEKLEGVLAS